MRFNTVLIQKMTVKMMRLSETVDVNEPSDEELFWLLLHFVKQNNQKWQAQLRKSHSITTVWWQYKKTESLPNE